MLEIDHIVVTAATLDEGTVFLEAALGVALSDIGHHEKMGTHNRLIGLGNGVYAEVIAIDPDGADPGVPRWYGLDDHAGSPRLSHWAARSTDLGASLENAPPGVGVPKSLQRAHYRWRFAIPPTGHLPFDDMVPALLQWEGDAHPAAALPTHGCALIGLFVTHPDMEKMLDQMPELQGMAGVAFSTGAAPGLRAEIDTPRGRIWLG